MSSCSLRIDSHVRFVSSRAHFNDFNCVASEVTFAQAMSASALESATLELVIFNDSVNVLIQAVEAADASRSVALTCDIAFACSSASFSA